MLRIIEQDDDRKLTFRLVGKLVGEWSREFECCWQRAVQEQMHDAVHVDLTEVTFVDASGKRLLAVMARAGAELFAVDVMMKALVEQIEQGASFNDEINLCVPSKAQSLTAI